MLLAALIGVAFASGCSCDRVEQRQAAISVPASTDTPSSRSLRAAALSAGGQSCADPSLVLCSDGCCPSGSACSPDGGCDAPLGGTASCPPELPVGCGLRSSCDGGTCFIPDFSGNANHAALGLGASLVPGLLGEAAATNEPLSVLSSGYGSLITAPTSGLPPAGPFTVEMWVRAKPGPAQQTLFAIGASSTDMLALTLNGPQYEWPAGVGCSFTGPSLQDGQWHFIAAVYEQVFNQRLYIDGIDVGVCGSERVVPSADLFFLGNQPVAPLGFRGEIDEVRIVNLALTQQQIQADQLDLPLQPVPGTIALWHFDTSADSLCCPAGTGCDSAGRCGSTVSGPSSPQCPPASPVLCADGGCCANGQTCNPGGCGAPVSTACSANTPVACPGRSDCCPAGFQCAAGGTCTQRQFARDPGDAGSCSSGQTACGEGCCQANESCSLGACCPSGGSRCGATGICCGQGEDCLNGTCSRPAEDAGSCPSGTTACGTNCCPAGVTCSGTVCVQTQPATATCGDASRPALCGDTCCGPSQACTGLGNSCFCALGGGCRPYQRVCPCPDGAYCGRSFNGQLSCHYTKTVAKQVGPGGVPCGNDPVTGARNFCPVASVCTGADCCPFDYPVACGASCCLPGGACVDGQCACPGGTPGCNGECCGGGSECRNGTCVTECTAPGFPTQCGNSCCAAGIACTSGACACPSTHPSTCGDNCCLAGAPCNGGQCGCPNGRAECGDRCCAGGQTCEGGLCVTPEELGGGGGSCPSGYNYCTDPGGNGVDQCCPREAPIFCSKLQACITSESDAFYDGSCGAKTFCSSGN